MFHSPSSQTRTPGAFLRGGGRHLSQAFSTPRVRYVFLSTTLCFLYHISFTNGSLPGVSPWVLCTVRSGYTLQFVRNTPPLRQGSADSSKQRFEDFCATAGTSSLLLKGVIEEVPRSDIEQGFFSHYFLVPKKDGGLRPILDLRRLNLSLYKGKFKMLTLKAIMSQVQGGDWFVTIDLKDAYFHIQVIRRHRKFLWFAFGGKAYQYKVLPFGLALAPRTFTKCMYAALAPLRFQGIRVLNYLDDWLILAHSRELVSRHRDIVLQEISFSHLNRQGGSRSRTLDRLAHRLLLWSQDKFLSLRAVHVPGILNLAADFLSRQELRPGEWVLNRHTVAQIWDLFGEAEVDLFASQESSRCPLWFSLSSPATLGRSCVRPSGAEHETVRVSASQADSGIPMQGEGER